MRRKRPIDIIPKRVTGAAGYGIIKFCLNCDDMDDLALSGEADDLDRLRRRFQNCEHTGNFDGDICSRLFVAEPGEEPGPLFDEEPAP